MEVLDCSLNAAGDDHCTCLAPYLAGSHHLLVKVIDHDLGFESDGVVVTLHITTQLLLRLLRIEFRIIIGLPHELVVALHRCV